MKLIDRAARALAVSRGGADPWETLEMPDKERWRKDVRVVLEALREPDERMAEAGTEIIRSVSPAETVTAHHNDAVNTWRYMIDTLLGEKE